MSRSKLLLPSRFGFTTTIPIRITDINYGGHVGNDAVLSLIHEARMRYLNHLGQSEMNFWGSGLIMGDVSIEFKRELFYGDSVVAQVTADNVSRVSFDIYYRFLRNSAEGEIAALAKTGMICYNYAAKKIAPVPEGAKEALTK